ncbi:MAG: lactonase family protein [Betaproteobacteria bacterium]|nr:lactonase family protein [Betaproteobacteria bacterium]
MNASVMLYSAVDEVVTHYEVDVEAATLTARGCIRAPSFVQEGWAHPSGSHLYLTTSNRSPGMKADMNHVSAYRIDAATGRLTPHGVPQPLAHRAVNVCLDPAGAYAINAHNLPQSGLTIHGIHHDGTLGAALAQAAGLVFGSYPHQVRVTPSGRTVVVADRGNKAEHGKAEDPGALRAFTFENGVLSDPQVIAPNGGYGFGPRHVDFHPRQPWMYVSDEKRSLLYLFRMPGDRIEADAAYTCDTLQDRAHAQPRQQPSTIHVHPNGRFVYIANRADHTVEFNGQKVFGGGENTISAFAIDATSGEPRLIQHADAHAYHVRTFAFDPSGRLMVAASIKPMNVREGNAVRTVPARLSVFRCGAHGKLEFVRAYDVDATGKTHYWMTIVGLGVHA